MTRTDQIMTVTADVECMMRAKGYTNHYAEAFADGFHEGAVWADTNPQWHKWPDEKPEPKPETDSMTWIERHSRDYLCYIEGERYPYEVLRLDPYTQDWFDYDRNIVVPTAWMEFPQPLFAVVLISIYEQIKNIRIK